MQKNIWSVSQLTTYIKRVLENDWQLTSVLVKGEISNFTHHYTGHMYFSIKDSKSTIRCVMFAGNNKGLKFQPKDGMMVHIKGKISLYESAGQYQIMVTDMIPDGVGELYLAYEETKEKLYKEGLFDEGHKKDLPAIPKGVAVITSATGAVIRDIISTLGRRNPGIKVYLIPSLVQGEDAAADLIRGLDIVENYCLDLVDVVIIGRGGGSIEDLWAFNKEELARRVFRMSLPVISAVGHETDTTIIDFVADLRAPTPTAAAEMVALSRADLRQDIDMTTIKMASRMGDIFQATKRELKEYEEKLQRNNPVERLLKHRNSLQDLTNKIQRSIDQRLNKLGREFALASQKLDDVSPLKIMQQGYSLAYESRLDSSTGEISPGMLIRTIKQVKVDDMIEIRLLDGRANCQVRGVKDEQSDK